MKVLIFFSWNILSSFLHLECSQCLMTVEGLWKWGAFLLDFVPAICLLCFEPTKFQTVTLILSLVKLSSITVQKTKTKKSNCYGQYIIHDSIRLWPLKTIRRSMLADFLRGTIIDSALHQMYGLLSLPDLDCVGQMA